MHAEQRQVAANRWTKPTDLSYEPTFRHLGNYLHHCHLLLLTLKTDTRFTYIPWTVEG